MNNNIPHNEGILRDSCDVSLKHVEERGLKVWDGMLGEGKMTILGLGFLMVLFVVGMIFLGLYKSFLQRLCPKESDSSREARFFEEINKRIVLDKHRKEFVKTSGNILLSLVNNKQGGKNRYNVLLLGRKGMGKSRLLDELEHAAKEVFPEVGIAYINLQSETSCLPSEAISALYGMKQDTIVSVIDELLRRKKKILVLVDEFQLIYTATFDPEFAKKFMLQISTIADCSKGIFYCIVTGSSSVLRSLCFCKGKNVSKHDYPNYCGVDMNSTKLQPYWIYPFLEQESFKSIVSYNKQIQWSNESDLCDILLSTCAVPGLVMSCEHRFGVNYTLSLKGNETHPLFQILCKQICVWNNNDTSSIEKLFSVVKFVDKNELEILWRKENQENSVPWSLEDLFEYADKGLIRFEDNQVSFAHPLQFFEVFREIYPSRGICTPIEYAELKYATKGAEKIAMRILSEQSESWLGFKSKYQSSKFNIPRDVETPLNPLDYSKKSFTEFFDNQDCVGIDGVTFNFENNSLSVHRYQIKLGKTSLKEYELESLKNKWISNKDIIIAKYSDLFKGFNINIFYILITTRPAEKKGDFKKLISDLKENNINAEYVSKNTLAAKVWAPYKLSDLNPCYGENMSSTE